MKKMIVNNIWEDTWFSLLEPQYKLLWFYIITKIDSRSCYEVNLKVASFHCGYNYDLQEVKKVYKGKYYEVKENLWFIPNYIKYHHGNKLSRFSNFHKPVIDFIEENNLHKIIQEHDITIQDSPLETISVNGDDGVLMSVRKYWRRLPSPYELEALSKADKEYLDEALRASSKYNKQSVAYVLAVIEGLKKKKAIEQAKTREAQLAIIKAQERKKFESPEVKEAWLNVFAELKKELNIVPTKKLTKEDLAMRYSSKKGDKK